MKKVVMIGFVFILSFVLASCNLDLGPSSTKGENFESFERLFDDSKAKTIHVKITEEKWQELDNAMVDYFVRHGHYRTDYMVEADFEFSDDLGTVSIDQIGIRTRGNMSRDRIIDEEGNPQLQSFKLSFHENYDPKNEKRTVFELEEIDLKSNRNWDPTYLTEKFSLDLFSSFGLYAAETTLVKFKISIGEETYDYGIFTAFEPIDDNFIKRRLTKEESQGNLYKSLWQKFGPANLGYPVQNRAIGIKREDINYRPSYDLKTNKVEEDHRNLNTFIKEINQKSGTEFYTYIEENFEVDLFLRYLAVGVLLGNPDDYRAMGNNYYLYQNSSSSKWVLIPYDYDHGMGQGWDGAPVFSNWSIGMNIYRWGNLNAHNLGQPGYPHVLVDKLLSHEPYQLIYEDYLEELVTSEDSLFSTSSFLAIYNQQKDLYDSQIDGSMMGMHFGLRDVENYINQKRLDVLSQLNYYDTHPLERGF